MKALYAIDKKMKLRRPDENESVQTLYKEYLGKPGSHKSHEVLHTHYFDRRKQEKINLTKIEKEDSVIETK